MTDGIDTPDNPSNPESPYFLDCTNGDYLAHPELFPLTISIHGDPNPIAWAAGLDIELPIYYSDDKEYWERIRREGWKPRLRGKIVSTWEPNGDWDYAFLKRVPGGELWYDIEEGIKIFTTLGDLKLALGYLQELRRNGAALTWIEPGDPDDGVSMVWITQRIGIDSPDPTPIYEEAGLVPHRRFKGMVYELPPHMR
ncbi:hypothetical protein IGS68_00845 [Skermanella sp. TT6]|uniref:N-acetyltransferase domain-containing protein n=1 Tax=Skermanella cutis TaxID=2775420 RepID=A0ABX7B669_9PROT|nr:hypothetical protein [Skermanella sp. TT6]QQP89861.1 hypothetical protein IGS68_00845 [Skermanella sp. TT6]